MSCFEGLLDHNRSLVDLAAFLGLGLGDAVATCDPGGRVTYDAFAVTDPAAAVRADVERPVTSPLATSRIVVSGHILDLRSEFVSAVVSATAPRAASEAAS